MFEKLIKEFLSFISGVVGEEMKVFVIFVEVMSK